MALQTIHEDDYASQEAADKAQNYSKESDQEVIDEELIQENGSDSDF